jgi:hypothetical protein
MNPRNEPCKIEYSDEAAADMHALRLFDRRSVVHGIETHLAVQPKAESRSRFKAMAQPF